MWSPVVFLTLLFAAKAISIPLIPKVSTFKTLRNFRLRGSSQEGIASLSRPSKFNQVINKIFDDADTNNDGTINMSEFYELVLKLYVQINRKAPLDPPTRETATKLFQHYDKDRSNAITKDEFTALATRLGQRAFIRIATFQIFKILVSPLLAEYLVRKLTGKEWLQGLALFIVPDPFEEKVIPIISSPTFGRTVLIILFMSTLGKAALAIVNMILDMSLRTDKRDK